MTVGGSGVGVLTLESGGLKTKSAAVGQFYNEIEEHPASSRAWRELGVSFYEQGEMPRAEEALKQAAAIQTDARTHLYLGLVYEQQGEHVAYIIKEALARSAATVEPSQEAQDEWIRIIRETAVADAQFAEQCTPGYYNNEGGGGGE